MACTSDTYVNSYERTTLRMLLLLHANTEAETACQKWGDSAFMKWGLLLSF